MSLFSLEGPTKKDFQDELEFVPKRVAYFEEILATEISAERRAKIEKSISQLRFMESNAKRSLEHYDEIYGKR